MTEYEIIVSICALGVGVLAVIVTKVEARRLTREYDARDET